MSVIQEIFNNFRENSLTQREKGTSFEELVIYFLQQDKRYASQFTKVQSYKDWAKDNNQRGFDSGIDLVATNNEEYEEGGGGTGSFTAVQCKFYNTTSISKAGIDSFVAASDKNFFSRRILVDTSEKGLNLVVAAQLENSTKDFTRISLEQFENSSIDWVTYQKTSVVKHLPKKTSRPHQTEALHQTLKGFATSDRGKLLMACGTGKTFTALKIAENYIPENRAKENHAKQNKLVLFLVPSLALMSQTITEWVIETTTPLHLFAVCSDVKVGTRKKMMGDIAGTDIHDLAYPATTDAKKLADKIANKISIAKTTHPDKMTVVFSTYQSIDVIHNAQTQYGMRAFDLIICDEAHRTTGATLLGEDDAKFVRIHNNDFIKGAKRLYMTATPRIYIDQVKEKAKEKSADVYSMDDVATYGQVFYSLKFGEAVECGLLSDYKVLVLAVDETEVAKDIQKRLSDSEDGLKLDDATKMIGCYKALIKHGIEINSAHIQRAVAFCNSIKSSKLFTNEFGLVVKEYLSQYPDVSDVVCELQHVDGTMDATERTTKLSWLKENTKEACRILSNARCLSEGVDVPSLDAVMFIHGRKSQIDIVQSVGRVMRISPGKKLGYVIIPVGIPAGINADEALNTNVNYQIVWDVLNALRSHDERLDANINKIELLDNLSDKIEAIKDRIEIVATVKNLPQHKKKEDNTTGIGGGANSHDRGDDDDGDGGDSRDNKNNNINLAIDSKQIGQQGVLELTNDSIQRAILARIVDKCGTRTYWEDWANDISDIANKHITRIKVTLEDKSSTAYQKFQEFVDDLKDNINDSISNDEVIEMLAQHIITKPVFNALFNNYNFTEHNSISKSMQSVLDILDKHNINNEAQKLDKFYASVKRRADGINSPEAKQTIITDLYDKFFRNAFPRMTERLGIVYTPVECIDFIIHSVNDVLKQEFAQELGDQNTHIIDPFTGTGTFITRLMQSGLLSKKQLEYKYNLREKQFNGEKLYTTELHANEIVLLAYYIASINIESVYHAVIGGNYKPFEGICLTDTFQLNEKSEDLITPQLADNNHRRKIQKKLPIRVFIGNPPYSAGQTSGNDNNQNIKYPKLDKSIENSYVKHGTATLKNSLYDSYIRAFRWASDRIDKYGVIGFITNAGWIDSNSADGMRKCLKDEFSTIYIFHLRGGIRGLSGDNAKKEGENVFNIMTPVAITVLVKNPNAKEQGKIYFYDIGEYLNRKEKIDKIVELKSLSNITKQNLWQEIIPDKYNDWLNQRVEDYYEHISIGDKKNKSDICIFENYSRGLATSRDAWVYNYSKTKLTQNISNMIDFYNSELERYKNSEEIKNQPNKLADAEKYVTNFVNNDNTKIAWSRDYRYDICRQQIKKLDVLKIIQALYRPYAKTYCFYDNQIAMELYQLPKIFPEAGIENLVIGVTGLGSAKDFSSLISNILPDLEVVSKSQQFSMYLYEPHNQVAVAYDADKMFDDVYIVTAPSGKEYKRRDAITDAGLKHFTDFYSSASSEMDSRLRGNDNRDSREDSCHSREGGNPVIEPKAVAISKEDIFYYIYGLLHSEEYKTKYADNLTKALPRIPRVKTIADFRAFEQAGRKLAKLHLDYENAEQYQVTFTKDISGLTDADYYVKKMKFPKILKKDDKSKIAYNSKITIENIPLEAYEYIVNGKSAIEWVMERQGVSTHKDSGIVNDANDWAMEAMNNARYPLELLLRVITVSLETVKIVNNLPKLDI